MIEGLHTVCIKRPGRQPLWYVYAWRGGPCIMKATGVARPKLDRAALEAYQAAKMDDRAVRSDTLEGLARDWRSPDPAQRPHSPEWRKLAHSTRETWGLELDRVVAKWGETPLALWNDPRMVRKVVEWRDSRAATPRSADIGVTVLAELLKFARLRARVAINVAAEVPAIYESADRAEIIWTEADIAAFRGPDEKPLRASVQDILDLACLTGFRRADLCAVTLDEVGEKAIVRTAEKKSRGRRRRAVVPIVPELRTLIATLRSRPRADGVRTLLVNTSGKPWPPASMTQAFNAARDDANAGAGIMQPGNERLGIPARKKHLHDCRGTFVTKLCRSGLTNEEIAGIVAWSKDNVDRVRRIYVDDAAVVVALSDRMNQAG